MSKMFFLCLSALAFLNVFTCVSATVTFSFLPSDWYSWFWHGHAIVDNWLYVDGGEIWAKSGNRWNNFTMAFDLSKSWTTSTVQPVVSYHGNGNNMLTRGPSLWHDPVHNEVFWYGGWPYYSLQPSVWSFKPGTDGAVTWGNQYSAGINTLSNGTNSFNDFTSMAGALYASTSDTFYSLGGYAASTNDPALTNAGNFQAAFTGLLEYDNSNAVWSNTSSASYQRAGFGIGGSSIYVPIFGKAGILVFLGGDAPTGQEWGVGSVGTAMVAMTSITVYDIETSTFYEQTAYGTNIPKQRVSFCAVGAGAADNATWEIFVYGGFQGGILSSSTVDQTVVTDLQKVYILTLPAFEWVVAPVSVSQRHAHQCSVVGNRQMLSTGGVLNNNGQTQDPWINGLALFDMTALSWGFKYNASAAPYVRSDLVVKYYNSSTTPYPPTWNNIALKTIFKDGTGSGSTNTTIINGNGGSTTATPSPSNSAAAAALPVGAIAGIAIAGVVGVAFILAAAFFWRRSRKAPVPKYQSTPNYMLRPEMSDSDPRSELSSRMINEVRGDDGAVEIPGESDSSMYKDRGFWFKRKPLGVELKSPVEMDASYGAAPAYQQSPVELGSSTRERDDMARGLSFRSGPVGTYHNS